MVVSLTPTHAAPRPPAQPPRTAQTPLVGCSLVPFGGVTVCQVDMSAYGDGPGALGPACPGGVISNSAVKLCAESFATAMRAKLRQEIS